MIVGRGRQHDRKVLRRARACMVKVSSTLWIDHGRLWVQASGPTTDNELITSQVKLPGFGNRIPNHFHLTLRSSYDGSTLRDACHEP